MFKKELEPKVGLLAVNQAFQIRHLATLNFESNKHCDSRKILLVVKLSLIKLTRFGLRNWLKNVKHR